MDFIGRLLQVQEVALGVLKAGGFDCQPYDIWRDECEGAEKLRFLSAMAPLLPAESPAQRYAEVLLGQMMELLALGCSDELLMATHDFCDGTFDAVSDAIQLDALPPLASPATQGVSPATNMAMAA